MTVLSQIHWLSWREKQATCQEEINLDELIDMRYHEKRKENYVHVWLNGLGLAFLEAYRLS